jgi:DNA-binding XRE family transcriptional regulator
MGLSGFGSAKAVPGNSKPMTAINARRFKHSFRISLIYIYTATAHLCFDLARNGDAAMDFNMKAFRANLGLSQSELADKMGLPLRTYQDIESGKSPVKRVHQAAARYAEWEINRALRKSSPLPPRFFIARFRNHDGHWTNPWTVWAVDYPEAVDRFYNLARIDKSWEISFRIADDYATQQDFPHSIDAKEAVLEHRHKQWPQ